MVILDNLVDEADLDSLRQYALNTPADPEHDFNGGYVSIELADSFPEYLNLADQFKKAIPMLTNKTFDRGWIYTYESECPGVTPHADPGTININLWITPMHCMKDTSKNGLIVYDKKRPPDWSWEDYNKDVDKIRRFLLDSGAVPRLVEYQYNRIVAFDSRYFHETNGVSTHPGQANKRINVTYMYN